jgi:hypothetical protein
MCDDAVMTLKYCKRGEALIPISAFMTKALFVFQVCQDGCDVSDCFGVLLAAEVGSNTVRGFWGGRKADADRFVLT